MNSEFVVIGIVVIGLSALVNLFSSIHKIKKEDSAEVEKLNKNFVEIIKQLTILNERMKISNQIAESHAERITLHGKEIDMLKNKVQEHELKLEYFEKERG